jgi:hypothetical protein
VGANIRLDSFSDYEREKANLKVLCGTCQHFGILHTERVHRFFRCHGWNTSYLRASCSRFRCIVCHGRAGMIRPVPLSIPLTNPHWFEYDYQFAALVKRLRNY